MQTRSHLLDDFSRLATGALGILQGAKGDAEQIVKRRLEGLLADWDLVGRDEFEVVRAMAAKARTENETLKQRIAALESRLAETTDPARRRARAKAKNPETAKPKID